jgi:hypothetical protein
MPLIRNFLLFYALILMAGASAQADFGNWFVANQKLSSSLDSSDKKLSFRFTCQSDTDLTAVAVYCAGAENPPAYLVSLQDDAAGLPSGKPLAFSSYIPHPQGWSTIPLKSVLLTKGKVYHLVLEDDVKRGGDHPVGVIGQANYAAFLYTDVLNHLHPNDGSPDAATNVLSFDGGHWKELNREPVYAVYGQRGQSQGNPYDDPGIRPIYGGNDPNDKSHQVLQGEALHFHCGFEATHFAIRIKKQGNPKYPLNYLILKNLFQVHQVLQVHKSVALAPDQVPSDFQWVTIGFEDKGISNFSPECWFLVLQTDSGKASPNSPGCDDCYLLSDMGNSGGLADAANLTFDGGPHLSRSVYSTDGGSPLHWLDDFENDSNLVAIGPSCPPPTENDFPPIPTPLPLKTEGYFPP